MNATHTTHVRTGIVPKCQSLARAKWLEKRQAELLDCEYFHVVFTLPAELATLALQNKRLMYDLLFRATADTFAVGGRRSAIPGSADRLFLHPAFTSGQTLNFHPHLHCVVPGGGILLGRQPLEWPAVRASSCP